MAGGTPSIFFKRTHSTTKSMPLDSDLEGKIPVLMGEASEKGFAFEIKNG